MTVVQNSNNLFDQKYSFMKQKDTQGTEYTDPEKYKWRCLIIGLFLNVHK